MVLYSGWLSISYSSSYYFRTCPTEEWLLITFSDRHTAKMFSCTKHLIALRWSHTCSGKLETGFFANKISINAKTAAQNSLRKITHLPVHGVKQLGSFESTWQIEDFSCKVKDSRRSGMYQSWLFLTRLDMQKSEGFRFYSIWRSESWIRPGSDAVLFMCRTKLNKFDFGATLARHLIPTAYRVSNLS